MTHCRVDWRVRFGDFEADLTSGELFRDGTRISIQRKPFRILEALLRSGGAVVGRERMMGEVWPDAHVEQHSINTAILKLRRALDDDATTPRLIETVGARGYRLMVRAAFRSRLEQDPVPHDPISIAVISFQNLGSPANDPFSIGLTDQMIVELRRVLHDLSVIVPAGTANHHRRDRSVDYILNGSVLSGSKSLRITARLIRAHDQVCVWSESYAPRKGNVLQVQDEISRQIARAVLKTMNGEHGKSRMSEGYRSDEAQA